MVLLDTKYRFYGLIKTYAIGHARSELHEVPRAALDSLSKPAEMPSCWSDDTLVNIFFM